MEKLRVDERLGESISNDVIAHCRQCGAYCDDHTNTPMTFVIYYLSNALIAVINTKILALHCTKNICIDPMRSK